MRQVQAQKGSMSVRAYVYSIASYEEISFSALARKAATYLYARISAT